MSDIEKYKKYYKGIRYHIEPDHRSVFIFGDLYFNNDDVCVKIYHASVKNDVLYMNLYLSDLLNMIENVGGFVFNKLDIRKRKLEFLRNDFK